MTIICAIHEPGVGTWLGCDTLVSGGSTGIVGYKIKWAVDGNRALALAGSNAALTVLSEMWPAAPDVTAPGVLWRWARASLIEAGFTPDTERKGNAGSFEMTMLYADPQNLFYLCREGGSVYAQPGKIMTIGCGCDVADGAAWAARNMGLYNKNIVKYAVTAAIALDTGCGGDPWFHKLAVE